MYVSNYILAVDRQGRITRQSQRGVQNRSVLGSIDVLAGEHRVPAGFQVRRAGQVDQQCQGLAVHPVLAVVDIEVADRKGQFAPAVGIVGEELPQVLVCDLVVVVA